MSSKPKRRKLNEGTGFGGQQGDTKRLLAGVRKAEKEANTEDCQKMKYLKEVKQKIKNKLIVTIDQTPIDVDTNIEVVALIDEEEKQTIINHLTDIFRKQVPNDWDKRKNLYNAALDLCRTLSSDTRLGKILGEKDDTEGILFWLVDFSQQAEHILRRGQKFACSADVVAMGDVMLATQVSEVKDSALKMSQLCHEKRVAEELTIVSLSERYRSELGSLRFDTVEAMTNHFFLTKQRTAPRGLNTRLLFKELAAYRTALPIEYGGSCFCRVIDSRLDLLRVLITGPDETPYANGCFFFDINLPASYPQTVPLVKFLTTGGGTIRFNPNLYNCGKVCLSLLGTWKGPGWVSGKSTLLQVLISIQSLILVPDPYFNEPGWECQRGTPKGKVLSDDYNRKIRRYTLDAAIASQLYSILNNHLSKSSSTTNRYPYPEFEDIVVKHFLEKRSLIEREIWEWAGEDCSLLATVARINSMLDQLAQRERTIKREARSKRDAAANTPDGDCHRDVGRSRNVLHSSTTISNKPIVLDLDEDDANKSIPTHSKLSFARKDNKTAIDIYSDDDNEGHSGNRISAGGERAKQNVSNISGDVDDDEIIDLT